MDQERVLLVTLAVLLVAVLVVGGVVVTQLSDARQGEDVPAGSDEEGKAKVSLEIVPKEGSSGEEVADGLE